MSLVCVLEVRGWDDADTLVCDVKFSNAISQHVMGSSMPCELGIVAFRGLCMVLKRYVHTEL